MLTPNVQLTTLTVLRQFALVRPEWVDMITGIAGAIKRPFCIGAFMVAVMCADGTLVDVLARMPVGV